MDAYRLERHEILYGLEFNISRDDCKAAVEDAKKPIEIVGQIVEGRR